MIVRILFSNKGLIQRRFRTNGHSCNWVDGSQHLMAQRRRQHTVLECGQMRVLGSVETFSFTIDLALRDKQVLLVVRN